jgi:hypothetical protein
MEAAQGQARFLNPALKPDDGARRALLWALAKEQRRIRNRGETMPTAIEEDCRGFIAMEGGESSARFVAKHHRARLANAPAPKHTSSRRGAQVHL